LNFLSTKLKGKVAKHLGCVLDHTRMYKSPIKSKYVHQIILKQEVKVDYLSAP